MNSNIREVVKRDGDRKDIIAERMREYIHRSVQIELVGVKSLFPLHSNI